MNEHITNHVVGNCPTQQRLFYIRPISYRKTVLIHLRNTSYIWFVSDGWITQNYICADVFRFTLIFPFFASNLNSSLRTFSVVYTLDNVFTHIPPHNVLDIRNKCLGLVFRTRLLWRKAVLFLNEPFCCCRGTAFFSHDSGWIRSVEAGFYLFVLCECISVCIPVHIHSHDCMHVELTLSPSRR